VAEEDLASFLAVAEDLKIDGLIAKQEKITTDKSFSETSELIDIDILDDTHDKKSEEDIKIEQKLILCADENSTEASYLDLKTDPTSPPKLDPNSTSQEGNNSCSSAPAMEYEPSAKESHITINIQKRGRKAKKDEPAMNDKDLKQTKSQNLCATNIPSTASNVILLSRNHTDTNYPIHCPVCNVGVKTNIHLQSHMRVKRETQCKFCKLFFENCQRLCIHRKGRCRASME